MGAVGVFHKAAEEVYKHRFIATLHVDRLAGGVPSDPKVVEGWLKSKFSSDRGDQVRELVLDAIQERGAENVDAAVEDVAMLKHLNGFKRDEHGLYIEGRQVKAMIKEAANIRWPKERWGPSRKGTRSFFAEHVFVVQERIPLGVDEPSSINQRFVHTWRGSGIQYEELIEDSDISFLVVTDNDFKASEWAALWVTAEKNGLGAARSQGFGQFTVTGWERA